MPLRRNTIEKKLRWANKSEAKAFAKKAEELGNLGMSYVACCDYLGWDLSVRREIMAKQKAAAKRREYHGNNKNSCKDKEVVYSIEIKCN